MRAPAALLWIRILGYGGTVLLVAAAVAVLVVQLRGGAGSPKAGGTGPLAGPSASVPGQGGTAQGGPGQGPGPSLPPQPAATGPQATGGTFGGSARCGSSTASYQQVGNIVRVRVALPPTGVVSASVQLKGQDQPQTKAIDVQGEKGPHVFEFTDIPPDQVQSISVTVLSESGFQTCTLTG